MFASRFQRQGYAKESARALMADAFRNRGIRRIVARCDPENTASWRLLERLGMRREGCLRRNIWFKTDREGRPLWLDTYEYALLREEYGGMDMGKGRTKIAEQRR